MKKTLALAAGVAASTLFVAPLVALPKGTEGYNKNQEPQVHTCGNGLKVTYVGPAKLWPPNHKYYEGIALIGEDPEGDQVTLTTEGWHDQYDGDTEVNGSGKTADDITADDDEATVTPGVGSEDSHPVAVESGDGTVTTNWKARAERSGRLQAGRTYTLMATASSDNGECTHSWNIVVPHDMRPSNR